MCYIIRLCTFGGIGVLEFLSIDLRISGSSVELQIVINIKDADWDWGHFRFRLAATCMHLMHEVMGCITSQLVAN